MLQRQYCLVYQIVCFGLYRGDFIGVGNTIHHFAIAAIFGKENMDIW